MFKKAFSSFNSVLNFVIDPRRAMLCPSVQRRELSFFLLKNQQPLPAGGQSDYQTFITKKL